MTFIDHGPETDSISSQVFDSVHSGPVIITGFKRADEGGQF